MSGVKKPKVREVLKSELSQIPKSETVALLLSSGIDSHATLCALNDLGLKVVCYSFMIDGGKLSTDFKYARFKAEKLGFHFVPIFLPKEPPKIIEGLIQLAKHGAKSKTDYECCFPILHSLSQIKEKWITSGHGADGHFCISKKGMIHFRDKIDTFRIKTFSNPRYCQKPVIDSMCRSAGKVFLFPWISKPMINQFMGTTWNQVNRPKQKQAILNDFPELRRFKVFPHVNLQLGDSGISSSIGKAAMKSGFNSKGFKSPVGVYNEITRKYGK